MKKIVCLLLLGVVFSCFNCTSTSPSTTEDAIDEKVDSVMNLMTLEEKIGQCVQYTSGWDVVTGPKVNTDVETWIKEGMVGSLLNAHGAAFTRKMQQIAVEETRLGIPLILGYDVIHGYKTIFPINLGSACSWDLDLIEKSARIAAEEASAAGLHWTFSPMLDVARDPRWGRIMEGAGEDPYLTSVVGQAYIKGFQGDDLRATNTVVACAKHFVAYGAAQAGRDYHTVDISERTLRDIYLPPFEAAVDAGVGTFMTSFNELNGIPASGNTFIYRDILRDEWGFDGFVVSDYTAINEMVPHGYAKDEKDAARLGMIAGTDMDMMSSAYRLYLKELIEEGEVDQALVEDACRRILRKKFELGLFDDPYRYSDEEREKNTILKGEFLESAREVAAHSIVLLKNDNVLPLSTEQEVALIGPLAADEFNIIGAWAGSGDRGGTAVSVQEAFQARNISFNYVKGTDINSEEDSGFRQAVRAARRSDVVVMVMGEHFNMSGEAASRTSIDIPGNQQKLIKAILDTGKPVVLVLMNGRPLALQWEHDNVPAIVEAWFPGTAGGHAIADVLYGDHNPSGKLTVTFPRNLGQVPIFYNYKNTGRPKDDAVEPKYRSKYLDVLNSPLYPFGHGLSYTTFEYSAPTLSDTTLQENTELKVSVRLRNTGQRAGHEIAQLYIRDLFGTVTRPVKELKGFQKVYLEPGEEQTLEFTIRPDDLKFYDQEMNFVVEAGKFEVFIGASSATTNKATFHYQ